ncbi:DNA-binding response regulator [Microbulbifer flavimaris]|uniref:DNA-binding response regulator n=1 Tax=Microbulbifer flavimaris TaxID=1781068 RepID=A0ABX4HY89_9GAMM|nr:MULTISPECIES: LytTR family DNA-binding domain-containing protein [Microbulbifer]KUJ82923.1 two-component system response regulator [Microbulbifer sp. ZGT114]PCO05105.1 DNA-binding response regulator [Microbulbifer flavimaris]
MTELGVLIVDDEPLARARLARQLEALDHCTLLGEAVDAQTALAQVEALDPDLVLLDIEMPGESGLALAETLSAREHPPAMIFCTAHDEFALPAFATAAAGYLLKPVSREQLSAAIEKLQRLSKPQRRLATVDSGQGSPSRRQIKAVSRRGVELLEVGTIRCLIADSKYVVAHHEGGETILDESLKDLEQEFADTFVRVHRNALVSRRYIAGLSRDGGSYRVLLKDSGERPQVSRRLLPEIRQLVEELGR